MIAEDEWRMPTRPAATAADWALWSKLPTAEVLSAVVLSLGTEPLKLSTRRRFNEVERRYNALVPGFRSRYALACANVSKTGPLHPVGSALLVNGRGGATVSLPEFGAWAIGIGWELPARFPQPMQAARPIASEQAPDADAGRAAATDLAANALPVMATQVELVPTAQVVTGGPATSAAHNTSADAAARITWWGAAGTHVVEVLRAGRHASAKALVAALMAEAGHPGSPFEKGDGNNRGELMVRATRKPLALKTVQNNWKKLRSYAALG